MFAAGAQFVADGVFYAELNELLTRELAEHGYSGVEVRVTPMRTEIIIRATRTQNVLGESLRRLASSNDAPDSFPSSVRTHMACCHRQTSEMKATSGAEFARLSVALQARRAAASGS